MGRVNAIDLNRNFKEIAADLAGRGKQELRAKLVNGQTVLYSRSVSALDKLAGNFFFDRAAKREAAKQLVFQRFELAPEARNAILGPAYFSKPTADVYRKVFENADRKMASKSALPYRFEKFLKLEGPTFENFLPYIEKAARDKGSSSDLNFVLNVRKIGKFDRHDAEELAARTAVRMMNDQYNITEGPLKRFAATFGVDLQAARRLTRDDWSALIREKRLSPQQLVELFNDARKEVARMLNDNIYRGKFSA